jgi:hypothetical protein
MNVRLDLFQAARPSFAWTLVACATTLGLIACGDNTSTSAMNDPSSTAQAGDAAPASPQPMTTAGASGAGTQAKPDAGNTAGARPRSQRQREQAAPLQEPAATAQRAPQRAQAPAQTLQLQAMAARQLRPVRPARARWPTAIELVSQASATRT